MTWIDVKDRLPEKMKKVVFVGVYGPCINIFMGYLCDQGWNIYLPFHSFHLKSFICRVTHWSELPALPDYSEKTWYVSRPIIKIND